MPQQSPYVVVLDEEQRQSLCHIAKSYTLPYFQVVRAQMILLAAEGMANKSIAGHLHVRREIVAKWRKRFFQEGLAGLLDRPRPGRPPVFPPSGRDPGEGVGL